MTVDELVKINNEKRKLLTEENEKYYTDMLLYIRMQWRLSEKQSEELLLELLDHLLDAQAENKTAKDVFGDNAYQYAHELIEEIATEKPRNMVKFVAGLSLMLIGWVLVIRGIALYVLSFVTDVNIDVNIFKGVISALAVAGFVVSNTWFILREVGKDLFKEKKRKNMIPMMKTGSFAAITMLIMLIIIKFTPEIGVSIPFSPIISLVFGIIILAIYYTVKIKNKIKDKKNE